MSPLDAIRLAPLLADFVAALREALDGDGNLRADVLKAIGEAYDLAAAVSPEVAALPRVAFIQIGAGAFQIAAGVAQLTR